MSVVAAMHDLSIDDWALGRPIDDEWVGLIELQNHVAAVYRQAPVSLQGFGPIGPIPIMDWTTVWSVDMHVPQLVDQVQLSVYAAGGGAGEVQFRITDGTNTATAAIITTLAEETATMTLAATGDITLEIQARATSVSPVYGLSVEMLPVTAGDLP